MVAVSVIGPRGEGVNTSVPSFEGTSLLLELCYLKGKPTMFSGFPNFDYDPGLTSSFNPKKVPLFAVQVAEVFSTLKCVGSEEAKALN